MENVLSYFENHPTAEVVFETTNEFLFEKEGDADAHAATLKDRKVTKHVKADLSDVAEKPKTKKQLAAEEKAAKDAEDKQALADLEAEEAAKLAGKSVSLFPDGKEETK